jgi:tRNA-modifying protein YgfZ
MPERTPSEVAANYQQARRHAALFDQSHHGKIELAGRDARSFLHNLCTNDIQKLAPGTGCEAFLLTAKARVVAPVLVFASKLPDGREVLWLDTGPGLGDKVLKHLDRYLISEQVELADRTQEFAQFHPAGPEARAVLQRALHTDMPDLAELHSREQSFPSGTTVSIRRHDPLALPGFDIVCRASDAESIRQALIDAGARAAGPEAYELLRVEAGTPVYGVDIDDERFVVEVGRTKQAICYTKGCYLGQEPVVMARDRGHVNRMLVGVKIAAAEAVPRGSRLFRDGAEAGQVTSSIVSPRLGTGLALAYLRRGSQEPGTALEVETSSGRYSAEVVSLPLSG